MPPPPKTKASSLSSAAPSSEVRRREAQKGSQDASNSSSSTKSINPSNAATMTSLASSTTFSPTNSSMSWYLRYSLLFPLTLILLLVETFIWRRAQAYFCGSFCQAVEGQQTLYFNAARRYLIEGVRDYSQFSELKSPAGVLYFYACLELILQHVHVPELISWVPVTIFAGFMGFVAYLMRRCRIPAPFLLFFVFPGGILLQGQSLSFVMPELLALLGLCACLSGILSGYRRLSIAALSLALTFDFVTVLPILPALSLALMRTLGVRKSFLWMVAGFLVFLLASLPFLLENWWSYLNQAVFHLSSVSDDRHAWNPFLWMLSWLVETYGIPLLTRDHLIRCAGSKWTGFYVQLALQLVWINFRWLKSDGGILGLVRKFSAAQRGHGIRPTPWTPKETCTVVFEALLLSNLIRFPSLAHPESFAMGSILLSAFFGVALSYPLPLPAVFGAFGLLAYSLSFLYREPLTEAIRSNMQFHLDLPNQLHFLPMILLTIIQSVILIGLKRDLAIFHRQNSLVSPSHHHFHHHHRSSLLSRDSNRRSLSQSRQKSD